MRDDVPKLSFAEKPEVIMIAWTTLGAIIGYSMIGQGHWVVGAAIAASLASLYNKANRILISLEILHRRLTPDDFADD
jgi:hypothetical protein